jgi:hypothetical protein
MDAPGAKANPDEKPDNRQVRLGSHPQVKSISCQEAKE